MGKSKAISSFLTLSLATSTAGHHWLLSGPCASTWTWSWRPRHHGNRFLPEYPGPEAKGEWELYTPARNSFWLTFQVWRLPREEKKEFWQLGDSLPFTPRRFLCGERTLLTKTTISQLVFLSANELFWPCFSELCHPRWLINTEDWKTACGIQAVASSASLGPRGWLGTLKSLSLEYALPGVGLQLLSLVQTISLFIEQFHGGHWCLCCLYTRCVKKNSQSFPCISSP